MFDYNDRKSIEQLCTNDISSDIEMMFEAWSSNKTSLPEMVAMASKLKTKLETYDSLLEFSDR